MALELKVLPQTFAAVHLNATDAIPDWALQSPFYSITRTDRELSIFCEASSVPEGLEADEGWRAFRVEGTLDFALTGIVSSLSFVLAARQISLFSISTYETDYMLVRADRLDDAVSALQRAGHTFV